MALGEPNPDAMLASIPSRTFHEWMAYYQVEPFGEWRADLRAANQMALLANVNRNPKKRRKPYQASDFMPDFGPKREQRDQTADEQFAIARQLNQLFGGVERHH